MKAVVQRVDAARVTVDSIEISSISLGLLVYLGVEKNDRESDADYLADKIINLRIFEDESGKLNLSLKDIGGELLTVSQFTLLADCRKGRRPSFTDAEEPVRASALYEYFIRKASELAPTVGGRFQAMMKIESINNGPVTILMDSRTGRPEKKGARFQGVEGSSE